MSSQVVRRLLPGAVLIALFLGLLVPSVAQAADAPNKPVVEKMQGRTVYGGNPWAISQPSCSSKRYYAQYPQYRYPPRSNVNWQQGPPPAQRPPANWHQNPPPQRYNYNNQCGGFYYQVRSGNTLSGISRQFGVSPQAIASANHLRNANRIYAGQRLYIPGSGYCR